MELRATLPLLFLAFTAGPAVAEGGQDAFNDLCASCHTVDAASTTSGPSLKGVLWRKIADLPDFAYSGALRAKVGTWTPDRLDPYLADSQAFAPGGDMFLEIREAATRQAIIDYLKTVK